ncbi:MAG: 50S ribosomal protein L25 [Candidatus Omnitrophota bacterium]
MEEIILDAELREEIGRGKIKGLRDKGFVPAVVYAAGKKSLHIKVSHRQLLRLVHQHRLESTVINLNVKEDKKQKSKSCLVKEIQYDPVDSDILHVDFNEVSLTEAIKVNVPVSAKGDSPGVKQEGGSLEHILWEVEVECLPTQIPQEIVVDISQLKIGDSILVKDIVPPAGVKVLNNPDAAVLAIAAPIKEEVPAEAVEGAEKPEPEVIKEKKEAPAEEKSEGEKDK